MVHLHVDKCLSHAVVEGKDGGIIENDINHLLKVVCTLWEEKSQLSSHLKLLEVLCGHSIFQPVGYWRRRGWLYICYYVGYGAI